MHVLYQLFEQDQVPQNEGQRLLEFKVQLVLQLGLGKGVSGFCPLL